MLSWFIETGFGYLLGLFEPPRPLGLDQWSPGIYLLGVVAVPAAGSLIICWGLWGDRSKGRVRCPKCWYDMRGTVPRLECPECGHDAKQKRLLGEEDQFGPGTLNLDAQRDEFVTALRKTGTPEAVTSIIRGGIAAGRFVLGDEGFKKVFDIGDAPTGHRSVSDVARLQGLGLDVPGRPAAARAPEPEAQPVGESLLPAAEKMNEAADKLLEAAVRMLSGTVPTLGRVDDDPGGGRG